MTTRPVVGQLGWGDQLNTYLEEQETDKTAHKNATAAHGTTGAVVGTTNTQTLTNKTLEDPVIKVGGVVSRVVVPCTSTTRPTHAAGRTIFETDTKLSYVSDGTNWLLVGPDSGTEVAGGALTTVNSTTATDITGLTQVVPVAGTYAVYEVTMTLDLTCTTAGATFIGELNIGGAAQGRQSIAILGSGNRQTVTNVWRVTGLSAASTTFKATGKLTAASGSWTAGGAQSVLRVRRIT